MNKVICGDCLEVMKKMPENSIDSILSDPPYGIFFMSNNWDVGIPGIPFWEEALRVAKPGSHMLTFGGCRTHHRLMCAIEDAGWEIRDTLGWLYGCVSEDTEYLTPSGWRRYHITTTDIYNKEQILIYDNKKDVFKWETPIGWSSYNIYEDTCYRIRSDYTDQLISRNHRCLVEREGELVFIQAEELNDMEYMPSLPVNFFEVYKRLSEVLLSPMQRILQGSGLQDMGERRIENCEPTREQSKEEITIRERKSSVEGGSNILQNEGKLYRNKICEMPRGIFTNGSEGWVCDGTQVNSSQTSKKMSITNGSYSSQRSRPDKQQIGEFNNISDKSNSQNLRGYRSGNGFTHRAGVSKIKYTGLIYCPSVSTGAFIARRNGKIFITGNSGFPKSLNISKAIDKTKGAEREVVGKGISGDPNSHKIYEMGIQAENGKNTLGGVFDITKPSSDEAIQWDGWGTALKPAWEPVILARKPVNCTVAENVLKWGTGGINIDECRVATDDKWSTSSSPSGGHIMDTGFDVPRKDIKLQIHSQGRFPANLIHDGSDEVVSLFPNAKGGNYPKERGKSLIGFASGKFDGDKPAHSMNDSGSASRFFYCAKTSSAERNEGLDGYEFNNIEIILYDDKFNNIIWKGILIMQEGKKIIHLRDMDISLQKAITECGIVNKNDLDLPIISFGKILLEKYLSDTKCIIRTEINSTMLRQISNLLAICHTSEHTLDVFLKMMGGGNLAVNVENSNILTITINEKMGYLLGAKPVVLKMQLKINKKENVNTHPTVKPKKLLRYLAKLITPPGGIILDPFAGSGSTGVAAMEEGFECVMIEIDEGYCEIAKKRNRIL